MKVAEVLCFATFIADMALAMLFLTCHCYIAGNAMTETNYAQSIKARLLNMADGDDKKYQQRVVRFFHERLLFRLSKSDYRERFILKGGALLYAFDEFMPRPTLERIQCDGLAHIAKFYNLKSAS